MKILVLGGTGFIGRNICEIFNQNKIVNLTASYHSKIPFSSNSIQWISADLRNVEHVKSIISSQKYFDVVIQAAATTSGIQDTFNNPDFHITDNILMNSTVLREVNKAQVGHFIFFSCTNMLRSKKLPQDEKSFDPILGPQDQYFGVGWTKVFIEKLCEFYSKLGKTKYTVIRHSNIYGPWDRYEEHNSHVCGATLRKVILAEKTVEIWGNGKEKRDLLYVDDLVELIWKIIERQKNQFCLVNAGSGEFISIEELTRLVIKLSKKNLTIKYNLSKPTAQYSVKLDYRKALNLFDWQPKTKLEVGLLKTLLFFEKTYFGIKSAESKNY